MKVCSICKEVKEFTEFSRHKGKNDGYSSSCLICLRKKSMNPQYYSHQKKKIIILNLYLKPSFKIYRCC